MGSQKQSHRVRRMERYMCNNYSGDKQIINTLIEQNHRLSECLRHYENRPPWWKFWERKKWEVS